MPTLHARLEIRYPEYHEAPVEPFAIVEMRLDDKGEYYCPVRVNLCAGNEYKFRRGQIEKKYERIRSIPYLIVAHIIQTTCDGTWEVLEKMPDIRNWKCMIAWYSVVSLVQEQFHLRWAVKLAGYDGPFTAG